MPESVEDLVDGIRSGDLRSLARAITLTESSLASHRQEAQEILDQLLTETGGSIRIGISGPPGVGKSTFIEALGLHVVDRGHRVAVLAVDPSSQRSGGSILGDKTRMVDLSRRPEAFIRPSPGGGQLGGVARRTREAMLLCEAAGFDVVIIETIGVGQSEVAVADMVDMFVVLVGPGSGDELQGIKRGIMELADLIVVNKVDGDLAAAGMRTVADYTHALKLIRPAHRAWQPVVISCSALEHTGMDEVWEAVEHFTRALSASGELDELRAGQAKAWMWSEVHDTLIDSLRDDQRVRDILGSLEHDVESGTLTPTRAARLILDAFDG